MVHSKIDHYRDDHIRLAVPQGTVGSLVTSRGSRSGRDSFLGAAEEEVLHPPVEKCDTFRMEGTDILKIHS